MSNDNPSPSLRERLSSPITWHYAGFAVLLVLVVVLAVRVGLDWVATNGHSTDVLAGKQVELKALDLQTAPLRGLDKRVEETREQMHSFYEKRIPPSYSSISERIGDLEVASGVRLTRVQYSQGKPGSDLTEINMEAGISGEYPQIMKFINSLERDPTFFVIRAMALTGQQGGLVNLRLSVSTWLRPADAEASGLPATPEPGSDTDQGPSAKREDE
jgi:type IV pilus assembly protein PilO